MKVEGDIVKNEIPNFTSPTHSHKALNKNPMFENILRKIWKIFEKFTLKSYRNLENMILGKKYKYSAAVIPINRRRINKTSRFHISKVKYNWDW